MFYLNVSMGGELRQELLSVIKDEAPEQLWHEIMNGNKMVLFLTCFGSAPVNEWLSFYDAVIDFFYKMYKQRSDVKKKFTGKQYCYTVCIYVTNTIICDTLL